MYELFVWTSETVRYIRVRIRGWGTPLFGLDRYVPLNMLWFLKFQITSNATAIFSIRVYNFTISSSTGCVFGPEAFISEIVKPEYEQSTFVAPSKKLSSIVLV